MEQDLDIDGTDHAVALRRNLDTMRKNKKNCDLTIKFEEEEMSVHKIVLMAQSKYFEAMLTHDTLENQSGIVEMKGKKVEPVKKCVDYFYTGKISTSEEGCEELLFAATMMQIGPVCDKIASFLQSRLRPNSFFDIKKIAIKFDLENTNKVCDNFAVEKLDLIVKEDGFNQLEMEYVMELLTSKTSTYVDIEDSKLATVLQWIKADTENRSKHLIDMVNALDLGKISPGAMKYVAENEPLFHQSVDAMKILRRAGSDKVNLRSKPLKVSFPTYPNAMLIFGYQTKSLQTYYPETEIWTETHPRLPEIMFGNQFYTSVVMDNHCLYVLTKKRKIFCWDMTDVSPSWTEMKDMLIDHEARLRGVVIDEYIYVAGKNAVERYSRIANEWEEINCIGFPVDFCAVVEYNKSIYCIGGYKSLNVVNKLSHASLSWSSVKPMEHGRHSPAAAVFQEKIFVAGGFAKSCLTVVECFDPKTDTWSTLAPMNQARQCFCLHAVDGRLYAVGDFEDPCTIEEYDANRDSWKIVADKPNMKILAQATVAVYLQR